MYQWSVIKLDVPDGTFLKEISEPIENELVCKMIPGESLIVHWQNLVFSKYEIHTDCFLWLQAHLGFHCALGLGKVRTDSPKYFQLTYTFSVYLRTNEI